MGRLDSGNRQGVSVASVVNDVTGGLERLAVLVPRDLGLWRGVDDADDFGLVSF